MFLFMPLFYYKNLNGFNRVCLDSVRSGVAPVHANLCIRARVRRVLFRIWLYFVSCLFVVFRWRFRGVLVFDERTHTLFDKYNSVREDNFHGNAVKMLLTQQP